MSNGTIYVIDTSAFMDWHDRFYPPDVFASLIGLYDGLISQGRLWSVELVKEELDAMGSATLQAWAKNRKTIFDPRSNHMAQALAIEGQFPSLKDPNAQFDEADAYVIALAQLKNAVVVTAETPASTKRKPKRSLYIPDVCSLLGMTSMSNLGMMRREGWKL